MIFVFDVGNTNIVLGVYDGDELKYHWRVETNRNRTEDEFGMVVKSLFDDSGLSFSAIRWHYYFFSCSAHYVRVRKNVPKIFQANPACCWSRYENRAVILNMKIHVRLVQTGLLMQLRRFMNMEAR